MVRPKRNEEDTTSAIDRSPLLGLLLSFSSGFIISGTAVVVKYVNNINPAQLAFYRWWTMMSFTLPQLIMTQQEILGPTGSRTTFVIRALTSGNSAILQFLAFRYLPLGEAAVLISCCPIFVTVACRIFLKEYFGLVQVISLLTTIGGLILITGLYQTQKSRIYTINDIYGIVAGLAASLTLAAMTVLTRKLRNIHFSISVFSDAIVGLIMSAITTVLLGNFSFLNCGGLQLGLIIFFGFACPLGYTLMIVALQRATAGPVTIMRAASDILFSFLWQVIIFKDVPDGTAIFGGALVCISVILTGFSQRINKFLPQKCVTLC